MDERIMQDDRFVDINPNFHDPTKSTIKITDANGVWLFNPNSIGMAFDEGLRDELSPMDDSPSICSGAPGIRFRTYQADLVLTPDEADRLTLLALTPREFFIINEAVGNFFWIHNDFYDPETGEALQPNINVPVEITDANGMRSLDPNRLFDAFNKGLRDELSPMDDNSSLLSGAPGICYRSHEAELVLTPDEAYRLVMRRLTPEEYFKIRAAFGEIFEINDAAYDPETGEVRPDDYE